MVTAAARMRTQSAQHVFASSRSRWRRTWRATSSTSGGTRRRSRSRSQTMKVDADQEITAEMRHLQEQKNEALRMNYAERSTPRRFET